MSWTFVEARPFSSRLPTRMEDETLRLLQKDLIANPQQGKAIPGCGGIRKIRVASGGRGKGKRGGVRIINLVIPEARQLHLLTIYGKDEKDDLGSAEKSVLKALAEQLRRDAKDSLGDKE